MLTVKLSSVLQGWGQRDGDRERICCIYFYWIDNDDITLAQNPVAAGVEF